MSSTHLSMPRDVAAFLDNANCADVTAAKYLNLAGNVPPWQVTGLILQQGQAYSLFADGVIRWSKRNSHLHGGPRFHLWARVSPGGRAVNLSANSGTFVADVEGQLEVGIYMGMWADEFGTLQSSHDLYQSLIGTLELAIVLYADDPLNVLDRLGRNPAAPVAIAAETVRLRTPMPTPLGWHYLHETGYADIYRSEETIDGSVIHVDTTDDQGILRHPVDFPLTTTTTVQWRWQVNEHPSLEPEDRAISHDYISLATEFDNGRDLTWIWSSCLAPGTHFQCPVRVWRERETHYVIRAQNDRLGQWYAETRNVYHDVSEAMGPPPARITAIWLIALSTFQHRVARASFAGITLANDELELSVL